MKKIVFLLFAFQSCFFCSSYGQNSYDYLFFEAKNQSAVVDGKFPLMIFLHGAGERGEDLELVKKHGPPKIVETDASFPFYLISPQCPKEERWEPTKVKKIIDEIVSQHPIDMDRIYMTGLSMGGYGTWSSAIKYPNFFAAIAPICGGSVMDAEHVDRIAHLPTWAFHGDADKVVPESNTAAIMKALKKVNPTAKYTIYPGVGHDSWTQTYANPDLYTWLLGHKK